MSNLRCNTMRRVAVLTCSSVSVVEWKSVVSENPCARAHSRTVRTRRCYEKVTIKSCYIAENSSVTCLRVQHFTLPMLWIDSCYNGREQAILLDPCITFRVQPLSSRCTCSTHYVAGLKFSWKRWKNYRVRISCRR